MLSRPLILIESPYRGNGHTYALNREYLEHCLRDSINRGECPLATHKLYTSCLDDTIQEERELGMSLLHNLIERTEFSAIYYDLGISEGMEWGIKYALRLQKPLYPRSLYHHPVPNHPAFGASP